MIKTDVTTHFVPTAATELTGRVARIYKSTDKSISSECTMPVVTVNEVCENLIKNVCSSNLTYQINQTPYSLYISIRKKFVKEFDPNSSSVSTVDNSKRIEMLVNENYYVKTEFEKLLALYLDTKAALDAETQRVKAEEVEPNKDDIKDKLEAEVKVMRSEKKLLEKKTNTIFQRIKG